MSIKVFGALCVIAGCGGWGFLVATQYLQRIRLLRQLVCALDYMECELQYRSTDLPTLCQQTAQECSGKIRRLFESLYRELESQVCPNVERCMASALEQSGDLPRVVAYFCRNLGNTLGKFDLQGQLRGLDGIRQECRQKLLHLQDNHEARLRSYQTLGLCAGAALAILFI